MERGAGSSTGEASISGAEQSALNTHTHIYKQMQINTEM